ncbi:MAG: hypothetical protein ACE5K8_00560 [Candidatus Zixiibacteriota bacterium]
MTQISITAFIEVEFDFVTYSLDFGKVSWDETVTKSTFLHIKDQQNTRITDITTSSPFISAKQLEPSTTVDSGQIEIEVTLSPGLPLGRINETVVAHSNLDSKPEATLRLRGTIVGDVEVTPEVLHFVIRDSANPANQSIQQQLFVNNRSKDKPLKVLSVVDPDDVLDLELETLDKGQRYQVVATLKQEALSGATTRSGSILITTDNPDQKEITVHYNVIKRWK